ncbi:MAG: hypothetical protein AAGJ70_05645 [Pseudomonadota bacterium]
MASPTARIPSAVFRGAIVALFVIGLLAPSSAHAETFTWRAWADNDPSNGGRYTARLVQSVPETDNVAFTAVCSTRGQNAILTYNTSGLAQLKDVRVAFYRNGKEVLVRQGQVYRPRSSEGVSGILFQTENNDGLWSVLSQGRYLQYEISGLGKAGIHLKNAARAVATFRGECAAIQNATENFSGGESSNPENNVAAASSCNGFGKVVSLDTRRKVSIRFVNSSGAHRSVMWIDYDGQPKHYRDLAPGQSYVQQTYVGHPWMFTDGPGNCKEIFIPSGGVAKTFTLTFAR